MEISDRQKCAWAKYGYKKNEKTRRNTRRNCQLPKTSYVSEYGSSQTSEPRTPLILL